MGFNARAEVDARDFARVIRVIKSIDKDLANELSRTIKPAITPIAKMIEARVNANRPPMSGMLRPGPKQWNKLGATVRVTGGFSWRSPNLVTIDFSKPSAAGVAIAENAGSKSAGNSLRGQLFIRRIQTVVPGWDNGGRYLYRAFMPYQSAVYGLAENLVERWIARVNRKLESM
jgi:hypothetical protein